MDGLFCHARDNANLISISQANTSPSRQNLWQDTISGMTDSVKPFSDIAERLRWHRALQGMNQDEYASKIGFKRSIYSLWEAGGHRLSLDGALALRAKWGLSLDFLYEGIDDALPMTLRNAWRERP